MAFQCHHADRRGVPAPRRHHVIVVPLLCFSARGIDLYLKDESTHPTGSLKHRLEDSLV